MKKILLLQQQILPKHRDILDFLKARIYPWRKLTIGIDGADGVGKSSLARFLSWQLAMPTIETDMFLEKGKTYPDIMYGALHTIIEARHALDRPLIIAGMALLMTLEHLNLEPDILIYVITKKFERSSGLKGLLNDYRIKYQPQDRADYIYECARDDFPRPPLGSEMGDYTSS